MPYYLRKPRVIISFHSKDYSYTTALFLTNFDMGNGYFVLDESRNNYAYKSSSDQLDQLFDTNG